MDITDILSQYLYETQYAELQTDEEYQAANAAQNQAEKELTATLSPEQTSLFHAYLECTNSLNALELRRFFSRCSLILLPQSK